MKEMINGFAPCAVLFIDFNAFVKFSQNIKAKEERRSVHKIAPDLPGNILREIIQSNKSDK